MAEGKYTNQSELFQQLLMDETFTAWVMSEGWEYADYWEKWIDENSSSEEVLLRAKRAILELKNDQRYFDEKRKAALREKILNTTEYETPKLREEKTNQNFTWLPKAAVIALIVGLGAIVSWWIFQKYNTTSYQTAFGEIKTFILPDSSLVTLNSNSSLIYDYNKSENIREVKLKGEGFFDIVKIKGVSAPPFVVFTDNVTVRVLGTRFNVKHRGESTQVVLEEGSIQLALEDQEEGLLMHPDDMVEVKEGATGINQQIVEASRYSTWKEGILRFDGASYEEIEKVLLENYGIELRFSDQEKTALINLRGSFPVQNIDILLEAIANVTQTSMQKKNDLIIYQ